MKTKKKPSRERAAFLRGARWMLSEVAQYIGSETIVRMQKMVLAKSAPATQRKAGFKP